MFNKQNTVCICANAINLMSNRYVHMHHADIEMLTGAYGDSEKKVYYRMLKSIDVAQPEQVSKVLSMFGGASERLV